MAHAISEKDDATPAQTLSCFCRIQFREVEVFEGGNSSGGAKSRIVTLCDMPAQLAAKAAAEAAEAA